MWERDFGELTLYHSYNSFTDPLWSWLQKNRSTDLNCSLTFHFYVPRLYRVGPEVINRDALFWPKKSMHENSKNMALNLVGVVDCLQPQRSVIFRVMHKNFLVCFSLLPCGNISKSQPFFDCTLGKFWCQSCVPNRRSTLRLFIWIYLFKLLFYCGIQWHDSKLRKVECI